jgi:hypothetical protein
MVRSLLAVQEILANPYVIVAIGAVVLLVVGTFILRIRKPGIAKGATVRTGRRRPASRMREAKAREDAQALLRQWAKPRAVLPVSPKPDDRPICARPTVHPASPPIGEQERTRRWNEVVEPAQETQAARGVSKGGTSSHLGSKFERARRKKLGLEDGNSAQCHWSLRALLASEAPSDGLQCPPEMIPPRRAGGRPA